MMDCFTSCLTVSTSTYNIEGQSPPLSTYLSYPVSTLPTCLSHLCLPVCLTSVCLSVSPLSTCLSHLCPPVCLTLFFPFLHSSVSPWSDSPLVLPLVPGQPSWSQHPPAKFQHRTRCPGRPGSGPAACHSQCFSVAGDDKNRQASIGTCVTRGAVKVSCALLPLGGHPGLVW